MYRPDNWWKYDTKVPLLPEKKDIQAFPRKAFEAGADAMLEGLKRKGMRIDDKFGFWGATWDAYRDEEGPMKFQGRGYLVFIPEEEQDGKDS